MNKYQRFVLKGEGSLTWAIFTVAGSRMRILAYISRTEHLNIDTTLAEGQKVYRQFLVKGWRPRQLSKGLTINQLTKVIYG